MILIIEMDGYLRMVTNSEVFFKRWWSRKYAYNPHHASLYKTGCIPVQVVVLFHGIRCGFSVSIHPTEAGTLVDERAKVGLLNTWQGLYFLCNPCKKTFVLVRSLSKHPKPLPKL